MDNQEAIASLKTLCHTCDLFPKCVNEKPECFEAIELAISALQAQEAKNSNESSLTQNELDTISRKAAIDALRVAYWDDNIQSAKDDPCIVDALTDWAIRQVKALPSAQPDMSEYSSKLWRNAYERGKRDAQSEEDCDTCKHGYFGDDQCNNCRVRYPSHYERRTDD